jgi:hypothetical protein
MVMHADTHKYSSSSVSMVVGYIPITIMGEEGLAVLLVIERGHWHASTAQALSFYLNPYLSSNEFNQLQN